MKSRLLRHTIILELHHHDGIITIQISTGLGVQQLGPGKWLGLGPRQKLELGLVARAGAVNNEGSNYWLGQLSR